MEERELWDSAGKCHGSTVFLFFFVFINDIVNVSSDIRITMFADDTSVSCSHENPVDLYRVMNGSWSYSVARLNSAAKFSPACSNCNKLNNINYPFSLEAVKCERLLFCWRAVILISYDHAKVTWFHCYNCLTYLSRNHSLTNLRQSNTY